MLIEVEAFSGDTSPARRALATRIATESFSWLSDVVRGVVIRVPAAAAAQRGGGDLTCSVVVVLRDGRRFDSLAVDENVADALERACHDLRREIARELNRPLRRRRESGTSVGSDVIERRANGSHH